VRGWVVLTLTHTLRTYYAHTLTQFKTHTHTCSLTHTHFKTHPNRHCSPSLSAHTHTPCTYRYSPGLAVADNIVDYPAQPCTCDTDGVQPSTKTFPGSTGVGTITMTGPWCKCKETTGSLLTKRYLYANLGYKCNKYPALTKDSKCTIDTAAFPKTIDCTYNLVLAEGFALTFQVRIHGGWLCLAREAGVGGWTTDYSGREWKGNVKPGVGIGGEGDEKRRPRTLVNRRVASFYGSVRLPLTPALCDLPPPTCPHSQPHQSKMKIGFGSTGASGDLIAEIGFGMKSSPMPRSCFGAPDSTLGFPQVGKAGDTICIVIKWLGDKLAKEYDLGEMAAGRAGKGT